MLQLALDGFARQATTVFTVRAAHGLRGDADRRSSSAPTPSTSTRSAASTYLTIFSAEPLLSRCVLEIPLVAVMTCVDHMLGGPGRGDQPERPLTEIEAGVAARPDRAAARRAALLLGRRRRPSTRGHRRRVQPPVRPGRRRLRRDGRRAPRAEDQRAQFRMTHVHAVRRAAPPPAPRRRTRRRSPTASAPSAPAPRPSSRASSSGCRSTSPSGSARPRCAPDDLAACSPATPSGSTTRAARRSRWSSTASSSPTPPPGPAVPARRPDRGHPQGEPR